MTTKERLNKLLAGVYLNNIFQRIIIIKYIEFLKEEKLI